MAARHLALTSRTRMFAAGAVAGLVLVALFLTDAFVGQAATVTGRLSESHALFAGDCSSCHSPGQGVTNANCLSCHQKSGSDLRAFSNARHYEYHSGETDRTAPTSKEPTCASCHREHQGRGASVQRVAEARCVSCHDASTFGKAGGHPDFAFTQQQPADNANLTFPHVIHVREVMDRDSLPDAEQACLVCHVPNADGRTFRPLSYATSCDGCHLGPSLATPWLPLRSGSSPGVMTLDDIRRSGAPGSQWAEHWSPREIVFQGSQLRKRPVYHADPWVMDNLRRLRRELYPGAELADLLRTSADGSSRDARLLHREALQTLRDQVAAIRGDPSPDVQREVTRLNEVMREIERRLDEPFAPLDETRFAVGESSRDPSKDARAYRSVIDSLTKQCAGCHVIERATIKRVQTDQRSLVRAEFDHGAHVTHARCLDCHSVIPIRESLASNDDPPADRDRAEILNVPSIAKCQECHRGSAAPTRCASCHVFHPDKSHRSNLTR